METTTLILRSVTLALVLSTLSLCLAGAARRPQARPYALAAGTLVFHSAVFYVVLLTHTTPLSPATFNIWSNALRIHEHLLVLWGVWLYIWPARGRR